MSKRKWSAPSVARNFLLVQCRFLNRERYKERVTEVRDREIGTGREKDRETDRQRERDRQIDIQRDRQREAGRQRDWKRDGQTVTEVRDREIDGRNRVRQWDRQTDINRDG